MQAAYGAAKRVRTETAIGERPVSIAAAAVDLARGVHGDLSSAKGLLIGVGDMGHMVAEHLVAAGLERLTVTHPLEVRAAILARTLNCHRIGYDDRAEAMASADVVVTALGRHDYAVNTDMIKSALKTRRMRPMFLVDVAVPGDVDPAINRIDEAFLYELADLERIVFDGRASRETEAEAGRAIVAAEVAAYQAERAGRAAVPAVKLLRELAEQMRAEVLTKAGGDAEKATRLLLSRLLHNPSIMLRHAASGAPEELKALDRAIRKLFQLEDDPTGTPVARRDDEI
jgi:glutamyl-tRNA reductase